MAWPYGLTTGSFTYLVARAPTGSELQAALDAESFLGRLVVGTTKPVEVQSETPPLYEWYGQLDGKEVAFRIGMTTPSRLPGKAKGDPAAHAFPVVLWSTDAGKPDVVAAGAMACHAWAVATRGAAYVASEGAVFDLANRKRAIDYVLTYNSGREDLLRARYPDIPPPRQPQPGDQTTIEIRVY